MMGKIGTNASLRIAGGGGREVSRFRLHGGGGGIIAAGMNGRQLILIASALALAGCEDKGEVAVTERREATTRDESPKLSATADERFRNAQRSPVEGTAPGNWRKLPPSQFRQLNYRFGESGQGEVWVSLAAGGVLENVNRWLGQFGAATLDEEAFHRMRQVHVAGTTGPWVEARGEYASGMGAPNREGYALAGVVASVGGRILTVKMVGPEAEVAAEKPRLEAFAASLRLVE